MRSTLPMVIAWFCIAMSGPPAYAETPSPVVIYVEGPGAAALAASIRSALPAGLVASEDAAFASALGSGIGKALTSDKTERKKGRASVVRATKNSGATATVVAIARASKRGVSTVTLVIVDAKSGAILLERDVAASDAPNVAATALAPTAAAAQSPPSAPSPSSAAVPQTAPPPERPGSPPESRASTTEPASADAIAVAPRSSAAPKLVVSASAGVGGRRLAYNDQITSNMRPYQLFGAPVARVGAAIYPFAGRPGALGRAGVIASYARALGLSSTNADGSAVATTWSRLDLGITQRFGGHRAGAASGGISLGYTKLAFDLDDPMNAGDLLPGVDYQALRGGADLRMPADRLALLLAASWLFVVSNGGIGDTFTQASTAGIDLGVAVTWRVNASFEARADLAYTRMFYALHPTPGDLYVAGGALDEFLVLGVGVSYAP